MKISSHTSVVVEGSKRVCFSGEEDAALSQELQYIHRSGRGLPPLAFLCQPTDNCFHFHFDQEARTKSPLFSRQRALFSDPDHLTALAFSLSHSLLRVREMNRENDSAFLWVPAILWGGISYHCRKRDVHPHWGWFKTLCYGMWALESTVCVCVDTHKEGSEIAC